MPKYIVKLGGKYMEWSTIVDAPVSWGMTKDEFRNYYREEYGNNGLERLDERMARVEENGCSAQSPRLTASECVRSNRAGPGESKLTEEQIISVYCEKQPIDGWLPE